MKAIARFKNETWWSELAYVDKPANSNNGVKYLLLRQNLFDRTVDARGMKTKVSKETVRAILTTNTKQNQPTKICVDRGTEIAGEFRNYTKPKENKLTLQWVRLRLHLLDVQYDPWNIKFTVTCRIMDTSAFANCLNSSKPWIQEKIAG